MELKSLVALAWMELSSVDVDASESKMMDTVNWEFKATESWTTFSTRIVTGGMSK